MAGLTDFSNPVVPLSGQFGPGTDKAGLTDLSNAAVPLSGQFWPGTDKAGLTEISCVHSVIQPGSWLEQRLLH